MTGVMPWWGYAPTRPVMVRCYRCLRGWGRRWPATSQHGRPETRARQVFVLHCLRVGEPISSIVGRAVDNALRRAGMAAPMRGANLLRHSLATDLLEHGASLREIADLFGYRPLATTRIYASVDVAALREVALPWPRAMSGLAA